MTTAIVILNWNGAKFLGEFLPVLLKNTAGKDVRIVVADNGSTDGSVVLLEKEFPGVERMQLDKNYGFAGGYNRALEQIKADYYVLLNSDVEVPAGWLEPMLAYMNEHKAVAACQPKVLSYERREAFEHAGAAGGFIDYLGFPYCRGRVLGVTEADKGQYDSISNIFWATGACLLIRSEAFWSVGGFDDAFFAHMEEIDLCWRLKSRGYGIVCIPGSVVYHVGGGTLHAESPFKTYLNFRNNLLMLYKNLPKADLSKVLFMRFLLDYLAAIQLFVTGKPANALSVLKARRDYRKMRPAFEEQRKENMVQTTVAGHAEILQRSIVFWYYLRGKKTYSALHKKKAVS